MIISRKKPHFKAATILFRNVKLLHFYWERFWLSFRRHFYFFRWQLSPANEFCQRQQNNKAADWVCAQEVGCAETWSKKASWPLLCGCAAQRKLEPQCQPVQRWANQSPLLRMCCSPLEQKWNSTSVIIEQQGAKEVFGLERRNKGEEWAETYGRDGRWRNGNNTQIY